MIYVPPIGMDTSLQRQVIEELYPVSNGLVALSPEDSATFAAHRQAALGRPIAVVDDYLTGGRNAPARAVEPWVMYVWPGAVQDFLTVAGVNLTQARAERSPAVQQLPTLNVWLDVKFERASKDTVKAPNVIAILEGSVKDQYVVFSAHMDHR